MKAGRKDITLSLISDDDVRRSLEKIFPESIILDRAFKIVSISPNISETLGFDPEELKCQSVSIISHEPHLQVQLEDRLKAGFFEGYEIELNTREEKKILFSISGFYLGLIANIQDLIVLKLKNLDEISFLNTLLEAKSSELDLFVYRSAHNLRGPLATIQGLINLGKMCEDVEEFKFLINQMEVFTAKLDDILYHLRYFAFTNRIQDFTCEQVSMASIFEKLGSYVEEEGSTQALRFRYELSQPELMVENGELILSLLKNIESFFCHLPRSTDSEIFVSSLSNHTSHELAIGIRGTSLLEKRYEKIKAVDFDYVDIMREPEFTNLYLAKKIVTKLKGKISFTLLEPDEIFLHIILPVSQEL
jgi:light-regulated signal transduction histidine kinase (bacteriophytochrome)